MQWPIRGVQISHDDSVITENAVKGVKNRTQTPLSGPSEKGPSCLCVHTIAVPERGLGSFFGPIKQ